MCGRYNFDTSNKEESFGYKFHLHPRHHSNLKPNYNTSPSQIMPVVVKHSPNSIVMMRWGFIPSWSKDDKFSSNNARAETVAEKPTFKKSLELRRCVVPASGFYEWHRTSSGKVPYYIKPKNEDFFAFAGIYSSWIDQKGKDLDTFAIITTSANKVMNKIHDRMPAILTETEMENWLNPDTVELERLLPLLHPFKDSEIEAYPVTTKVNNASNNSEDLIQPIK